MEIVERSAAKRRKGRVGGTMMIFRKGKLVYRPMMVDTHHYATGTCDKGGSLL